MNKLPPVIEFELNLKEDLAVATSEEHKMFAYDKAINAIENLVPQLNTLAEYLNPAQ